MKLDGIHFYKSDREFKKYKAIVPAKLWNKYRDKVERDQTVHFGDIRYEQYKDKIGMYKKLDHNDAIRRMNYRMRHGSQLHQEFTFSPAYFSFYYLW